MSPAVMYGVPVAIGFGPKILTDTPDDVLRVRLRYRRGPTQAVLVYQDRTELWYCTPVYVDSSRPEIKRLYLVAVNGVWANGSRRAKA